MISLKYLTSHTLVIPFRTMACARSNCNLRVLGYLDALILLAAVCSGLYTCWVHTLDATIIVLVICGLLIFAFCGMLYYYFDRFEISASFTHLWYGCLLGLIAFTNRMAITDHDVPSTVTDALLLTSLVFKVFWSVIQRVCGYVVHTSCLLTSIESFELIGFAIACVISTSSMVSMWLLITGFSFTLMAVRLKVFLAIPCFALFITLSAGFFFNIALDVPLNPYALSCFVARIAIDPILDIYFSGLSTMERWDCVFNRHRFFHKLLLLLVYGSETAFAILAGHVTVHHEEWYFAIPAYLLFGFLWISLHIVFVITTWTFVNKLGDCNRTFHSVREDSNKNLSTVMASKGMRYFAMISRCLVASTVASTMLLGGVSWQNHNADFIASLLIVLPIEAMFHGVLHELGSSLGGTCTGYAVVGPSAFCRSDGSTLLLPSTAMEEYSSRSIGLLNTMQRFFVYHMIDIYSCDFSTSGLALSSLESKLKSFFVRRTPDGPRFDTYVMYYSGHVNPAGDWAMADNDVLKFETLIEWWAEANEESGARLIIVQDCKTCTQWLKKVQRENDLTLSLQSFIMSKSTDPETGVSMMIGDFTREWVDFNCSKDTDITWKEQGRKIRAVYGVSSKWSEFNFHKPTEVDIEEHWQQNFPRITHSLIKILNIPSVMDLFSYCYGCFSCFRRWKMKWLPPTVINTGHGFKLVRS